jgi:hypothetical protein
VRTAMANSQGNSATFGPVFGEALCAGVDAQAVLAVAARRPAKPLTPLTNLVVRSIIGSASARSRHCRLKTQDEPYAVTWRGNLLRVMLIAVMARFPYPPQYPDGATFELRPGSGGAQPLTHFMGTLAEAQRQGGITDDQLALTSEEPLQFRTSNPGAVRALMDAARYDGWVVEQEIPHDPTQRPKFVPEAVDFVGEPPSPSAFLLNGPQQMRAQLAQVAEEFPAWLRVPFLEGGVAFIVDAVESARWATPWTFNNILRRMATGTMAAAGTDDEEIVQAFDTNITSLVDALVFEADIARALTRQLDPETTLDLFEGISNTQVTQKDDRSL